MSVCGQGKIRFISAGTFTQRPTLHILPNENDETHEQLVCVCVCVCLHILLSLFMMLDFGGDMGHWDRHSTHPQYSVLTMANRA